MKITPILILYGFILTNPCVAKNHSFSLTSTEGKQLLKLFLPQLEQKNTTAFRQEQKNVVSSSLILPLIEKIKAPKTKDDRFFFKERNPSPKGKQNMTLTFYGKRAFFFNNTIKSNVKLRARFYLEGEHQEEKLIITRSSKMPQEGFLELKFKNPGPDYLNISSKIRVKIKDNDLMALYHAAKTNGSFYQIQQSVEQSNPSSHKQKIQTLFAMIKILYLKDPDFVSPMFAISYERFAYEFIEEDYTFKKHSFSLRKKKLGPVSYQLTIDQNVTSYLPSLLNMTKYGLSDYMISKIKDETSYHYPKNSNCVEIKKPMLIEQLKSKQKSKPHRWIEQYLVYPVMRHRQTVKGFKKSAGKLGHIRKQMPIKTQSSLAPLASH